MKFYDKIGFSINREKMVDGEPTGVWDQCVTEKYYYGELSKPVNKWSTGAGTNDDASFSSQLSIVSDPFSLQNFHSIKYVVYQGIKWKVTSVEIMRPRLLLTLGGEYIDG